MTQNDLMGRIHYDAETGVFTWLKASGPRGAVGSIAGISINGAGYNRIQIDGHSYLSHRLAWFYVFGYWPDKLDHINGIKTDNRIENLRNVNQLINAQNIRKPSVFNKSGFLGVCQYGNIFKAQISVNNTKRYIGTFKTAEEAHSAYVDAKRKYHAGCTI